MILVCGTKRSGTSLWMQMLGAAGYSIIGEAFPSVWEESIREANPRGFFESRLRQGVFFATNPDPESGEFIFPDPSKNHAVKVFVPGLVRTDYAFIDRVVGTMRHWSAYSTSLSRLYELEDRGPLPQPLLRTLQHDWSRAQPVRNRQLGSHADRRCRPN